SQDGGMNGQELIANALGGTFAIPVFEQFDVLKGEYNVEDHKDTNHKRYPPIHDEGRELAAAVFCDDLVPHIHRVQEDPYDPCKHEPTDVLATEVVGAFAIF
ncbi:hypothetical protein EBT25_17140, partial [bacterium]|nr:hypothetical protein [bacterium]